MRAQSSLNKLAGQSRGIILEAIQQQFSFMNETADELQTTTRRAVVAELGRRGGGAFPPYQQRVALCCGLIRLCIRTWNIPGGGGGGIERRSPEFNDVNLWILFFFLSPCSLCATVGGSFLYILRTEATAPESMNETMFPREHLPTHEATAVPLFTNKSSRLPCKSFHQFDSEKSTFHDAIPSSSSIFFWRNKPIKILLIAPDDGRERSSLA